jgi:uncharacterized membrane protein required for colicin V production
MHFIDLVFVLIIGGFGLFGLWFGLVHTLGSLLGTLLGAYLASRYYEPLANWLVTLTGWGDNVARVVMFVISFIVINRLVGFIFWVIDKSTSIITSLPFINGINRILGGALGLFEGAITLGLILYFIELFPLSTIFMGRLADSTLAPTLIGMASILVPLLPDALLLVEETVDFVEDRVVDIASTTAF